MIGIIHYNMGNITSVQNSLEFLGIPAMVLENPEQMTEATHIILPGVGAFSEGIKNLKELGFAEAILKQVADGKPFLGLCLGMQLLASRGTEGGAVVGLNLIPGEVLRLPSDKGVRVPHIGWNDIKIVRSNPIFTESADFYFVHSYYFVPKTSDDVLAVCDYGVEFPAAIGRDRVFGTQFHPEKSHQAGLNILKNFAALT